MELISRLEAEKLQFNNERRKFNSTKDYMQTYLQILQFAFIFGYIDEQQRNGIAESILRAIRKIADENDYVVSNYVYIIGMRFSSLSNYDCWKILKEIIDVKHAEIFIKDTRDWFLLKVNSICAKAKLGYSKSLTTRNPFIIDSWKSCQSQLNIIRGCLEEETSFDMKSFHYTKPSFQYDIYHQENSISYLDRIEEYIDSLSIEVSILLKFDTIKLFKAISLERSHSQFKKDSEKLIKARLNYNTAVTKLNEIIAFYTKKLESISESDKMFNQLYAEFSAEHSDMTEEEFEDAFDEYWVSSPWYSEEDYQEVNAKYLAEKNKQQRKIAHLKTVLDNEEDAQVAFQSSFSKISNDITLKNVIEEYAFFYLAKSGKIHYPSSSVEKSLAVSRLSEKEAVSIFLQNETNSLGLTDEEINYLQTNTNS